MEGVGARLGRSSAGTPQQRCSAAPCGGGRRNGFRSQTLTTQIPTITTTLISSFSNGLRSPTHFPTARRLQLHLLLVRMPLPPMRRHHPRLRRLPGGSSVTYRRDIRLKYWHSGGELDVAGEGQDKETVGHGFGSLEMDSAPFR